MTRPAVPGTHNGQEGPQRIQLRRTTTGASSATTYVVTECVRCLRPGGKGQSGYCTPECRFWSKVTKSDGCWLWAGAPHTARGYGRFDANQKRYMAHRYAYELLVGPVPAGLQLDHLCLNKMCVNPAHMEAITDKEHGRRSGTLSGIARRRARA